MAHHQFNPTQVKHGKRKTMHLAHVERLESNSSNYDVTQLFAILKNQATCQNRQRKTRQT